MPRSVVDRYTAVIKAILSQHELGSHSRRERGQKRKSSRERKKGRGKRIPSGTVIIFCRRSAYAKPEMISGRPRAPNEFIIQVASILLSPSILSPAGEGRVCYHPRRWLIKPIALAQWQRESARWEIICQLSARSKPSSTRSIRAWRFIVSTSSRSLYFNDITPFVSN